MLFVIEKMVRPDTHTGCSYIKSNTENMKMSHFRHNTPKAKLHISEWMNEISIYGKTYSEIVRQKLYLYSTLSCPLFKNYMDTRRSEWEEDKDFTAN